MGPLSRPTAALVEGPWGPQTLVPRRVSLNLAFTSGRESPFLTLAVLACLIPSYLTAYRIHPTPDSTYAISNRGDWTIFEGGEPSQKEE